MSGTPRLLAVEALIKMQENEGYSNILLDKMLSESDLDRRDKALASAIFYGTLEKRLTLDYYIGCCLKNTENKIDAAVREVLRSAAYQILFMDKVPDFAVVNEAVSMTKTLKKSRASGFVNGVLRGLIRNKKELDRRLEEIAEPVNRLSIKYSIPKQLIELWQLSYGDAIASELLEAFLEKPKTYIRLNTTKTTAEKITKSFSAGENIFELSDRIENAGQLQAGSVKELPQFKEGLFHVQDLSAQLVCLLMDLKPGQLVYDLCAAPGGKSFTIAEQMDNRGTVLAYDLYKSRIKLIESGKKRLELSSIKTGLHDAREPIKSEQMADRVLCDVPCSGYGVIRRKPEIRYKSLDSVSSLPEIQYNILKNGSELLKPGGLLFYTTCTLNPRENTQVAERFLNNNPGFAPYTLNCDEYRAMRDEAENMLTILPQTMDSDGFFIAAFYRKV